MADAIFEEVKKTALRLGHCDPKWLKDEVDPNFVTHESSQKGSNSAPMVLLHGLFGALSNWDTVFPLFAKYSNPISLSLPIISGHRSEVKVKALAAYTELFVRRRNIQPAILCGNSLGGHVALRLTLASPHLVDCMILSGASGLYEHSVDSLPVRPGEKFIREHMARVFHSPKFITDEAVDEIHTIIKSRMNTLNLIHAARSAKKDNLQSVLKNISVPTLLLWGEDDEVTTMTVAETFHKHIPNSELKTIKNCGHAPMIEHPEWFAEQVQQFLNKHSRYYKKP